jgi:hypothetical protein
MLIGRAKDTKKNRKHLLIQEKIVSLHEKSTRYGVVRQVFEYL